MTTTKLGSKPVAGFMFVRRSLALGAPPPQRPAAAIL